MIDSLIGEKLANYIFETGGSIRAALYQDRTRISGHIRSDVFLVEAALLDEELIPLLGGKIFALYDEEEPVFEAGSRITAIRRFLPADELLAVVFSVLLEENITISGMKNPLLDKELIAFFSPHGYELLPLLAEQYSAISGERRRTLLLSLCPYCGWQGETGYDMGDLFYYLRTKSMPVSQLLEACVREKNGYFTVPPFREPRDTEDLSESDMSALLNRLVSESDYETIVFAMPDRPFAVDMMFDHCSVFYLVKRMGAVYEKISERFVSSLGAEGQKRERLYLMEISDELHENMASGELAHVNTYIRRQKGGV